MWRLYLEVAILVVIAFAVGALVATVVVGRAVKRRAPGDDLLLTFTPPAADGTTAPGPGSGTTS